jgi:hypothetical protein
VARPARVERARQSVRLIRWAAPLMVSMHEMDAELADEEIWLLAVDFATMLFEASYHVPSFRDWYDRADLTPGYAYLRTLLQILQWYHPGERWLLKSPQHLASLGPLLATFPDATVVQTHRDPLPVMASMASMATYGRRMNSDLTDPKIVGRYWSARVEHMLRRSTEDRAHDDERFVDVQFGDLVTDPLGTVKQVYERADRTLAPAAERAMRAHLDAHPRAEHGRHRYRLEDFGLDPAERRAALAFYTERFAVPEEVSP